jgi:SAM-dependent methyltransferase
MIRENNESEWNKYWEEESSSDFLTRIYSRIASFYRNFLIGPRLKREIDLNFSPGDLLLHAGSGAGEVDRFLRDTYSVTALDLSTGAVEKYQKRYPGSSVIVGDITNLSNVTNKFNGVYNLGVMEHLDPYQINKSFKEMEKLLVVDGRIVLFWPPIFGLSVLFLNSVHFFLNRILKRNIILHPSEPNKVSTRIKFMPYLEGTRLEIVNFKMSWRDFFTYTVVTLKTVAEN